MNTSIRKDDYAKLAAEAANAESSGQLTPTQLDILYRHRLFCLFVPQSLGGLALSLPEALHIQEQLAYTDGSVGWTTTLCAGASWFVGFTSPPLSATLFEDPKVCFGGSGMDSGTAALQKDGTYLINGYWRYATGAPHLTVFTVNCHIEKDGTAIPDEQGNPAVRSFCLLPNEVEIVEDWHTMGLKATASHAFRASGLRVGKERTFRISPDQAVRDELIYRFPFEQFAELTLAANYLGMFRRFMDLCGNKEEFLPRYVHAYWEISEHSWIQLQQQGALDPKVMQRISKVCRELVQIGLREAMAYYPRTGIRGATLDNELNRVWRDIFTASQHVIFR